MIHLKKLVLNEEELEGSPIDGKTKTAAKNFIHSKVDKFTKGKFSDDFWKPVQAIWKELEKLRIKVYIQNAFYDQDITTYSDGSRFLTPIRKTYIFKIDFINQNDKQDSLFGRVVCEGTGPANARLDSYDVVLSLS
jgi:hypothetical protein